MYLGSPEVAVPPLRALAAAGFEIPLVVSNPDRKRGRGSALSPSPVKAAAAELGLRVTDRIDDVLDVEVDLGVVVAYGRLIKPHILDHVDMVNLHFSLLPRWRGAAPVERALLAGDQETGVCLMRLEEGLDTGPVYDVERMSIGEDETLDDLRGRLVAAGTEMLVARLAEGLGAPVAQVGEPSYASKIDPSELELRWDRPTVELHRLVRLGRAWTTFRGKRLKVLAARPAGPAASVAPGELDGVVVGTGDGGLELIEVQPEGKEPQPAVAWRNGARPEPDERLGG